MDYLVREITVKYISRKKVTNPVKIKFPADVAGLLQKKIKNEPKEHFYVVFLDGANQVIAYQCVSVGLSNKSLVGPKEVFQAAFKVGANAICVCHNHPSGFCEPSIEDIQVTKRLWEAGKILGVQVLDHVILTDNGFYSFAEHNAMPEESKA